MEFLGSSDVLERLDEFELDLTPVYNLVSLWEEYDYGNTVPDTEDHFDIENSIPAKDFSYLVGYPSEGNAGGGGSSELLVASSSSKLGFWGFVFDFFDENGTTFLELIVKKIHEAIGGFWESVTRIGDVFVQFGDLFVNFKNAVSKKINLLINTFIYLKDNVIGLLVLPVSLISQTFSFSSWLLGFGA